MNFTIPPSPSRRLNQICFPSFFELHNYKSLIRQDMYCDLFRFLFSCLTYCTFFFLNVFVGLTLRCVNLFLNPTAAILNVMALFFLLSRSILRSLIKI